MNREEILQKSQRSGSRLNEWEKYIDLRGSYLAFLVMMATGLLLQLLPISDAMGSTASLMMMTGFLIYIVYLTIKNCTLISFVFLLIAMVAEVHHIIRFIPYIQ